jgi:two-component system, NarL family, nitrate/nitrite response regulator NarL
MDPPRAGKRPPVGSAGTFRVALVHGRQSFVRGLAQLLPEVSGGRAEVVGSTGEVSGAAALVRRTAPDLVMVDLQLGAPGAVKAICAVRQTWPRLRIAVVSTRDDQPAAVEALRAGADAYLPRARPEDLVPLLSPVRDGWSVLPAEVLAAVLGLSRPRSATRVDLDDAERHLLRLIAAGCSTLEIADRLRVSERTVKRLTAALLRKLRVGSRTEAAAMAGDAGLL